MYAHFFRKAGGGWTLLLTATPRIPNIYDVLEERYEYTVSGKREARKIAAANGAICWNF